MSKKPFAVFLLLFILTGCTQEHLIFVRNIQTARLFDLDKMLQEVGLPPVTPPPKSRPPKMAKEETSRKTEKTTTSPSKKTTPPPVNETVLDIPAGKDFTLRIPSKPGTFAVLKSVTGEIGYKADGSNPDAGIYSFIAGRDNGEIRFRLYDLDGKNKGEIVYKIRIAAEQESTSSAPVTNIIESAPEEPEGTPGSLSKLNMANYLISSIADLPQLDQIKALRENLNSTEFSEADKQVLRYKLLDLLLERYNYGEAEEQIKLIKDKNIQYLYLARQFSRKRDFKNAVKNYLFALKGDAETRKSAILETEAILIADGNDDKNLIESLKAETEKLKSDKSFYGKSIINIARLYEFTSDIYPAETLLKSVINGDYPFDIRQEAGKYYEELKNTFLEYR